MQRYFVDKQQNDYYLLQEDMHHFVKVMRGKINDKVTCIYKGNVFLAKVVDLTSGLLCFIENIETDIELDVDVTLIYALTKGEKFDLVIQKATELGVRTIVPVVTKRCVVKIDVDKFEKKRVRYQKIAKEACQQCYRTLIPSVEPLCNLDTIKPYLSDYNLVAYEEIAKENNHGKLYEVVSKLQKGQSITIIVGSEGGFEQNEIDQLVEQGVEVCSLGKRILRSETAPLYMLSVIGYSREVM